MRKFQFSSTLAILSVLILSGCGDGKSEDPGVQPGTQVNQQTLPNNGNQYIQPTQVPQQNYYNNNGYADPCVNGQTTTNGAPCTQNNNYLPQNQNQGNPQPGCYYQAVGTNCTPCPAGYIQSGSVCVLAQQQQPQYSCNQGMSWQGSSCMPQGFTGCPSGMTWNWQIGACGCAYQQYLQQQAMYQQILLEGWKRKLIWDAAQRQYMAYYYYVQNAPRSRCFFNGWGWTSF